MKQPVPGVLAMAATAHVDVVTDVRGVTWRLTLHNAQPDQVTIGDTDDNSQFDIIGNFSVSLAMIMAKRNQSAFWSGLQCHGGDQLAVGNLDGI